MSRSRLNSPFAVNPPNHPGRLPSRLDWLIALGALWTSPNTLLGLLIGSFGLIGGARFVLRRGEYAIVFTHWPWGKGGALTLGNCILHTGPSLDTSCALYAPVAGCSPGLTPRLADHERAHVFQYMVLGPMFLPVYLACGGISARNVFERAADRYALTARGWWPSIRTRS
ncbi:MAG: hypothetical protein ABIP49_10270 [Lysobacterales bacterium]